MRDCRRAELYAAEIAAFDGTDLEEIRSLDDVSAVIASVVDGQWWPGPPVTVVATRRNAGSSSASERVDASIVIRLAAEQTTIATAAHELAHALAGPKEGHSELFVAAYLDVVAVVTNLDSRDRRHRLHVEQLRHALAAVGLVAGDREWPPPPEASSIAIAL